MSSDGAVHVSDVSALQDAVERGVDIVVDGGCKEPSHSGIASPRPTP
jgi:hypothetical protein